MARTARIKKNGSGVAYYHLMSRTNGRKFLFDRGGVKTQLVDALKKAAAFSGVDSFDRLVIMKLKLFAVKTRKMVAAEAR